MMLISIVIPTYNRSHILPEAIASAFSQLEVDVEIIVIDDGSTDNTGTILKSLPHPVRFFFQSNRGLSSARNKGLAEARGEYIIFLDSDDLILPEKAYIQSQILQTHPEIAIVYSRWRTTLMNGEVIKERGLDWTPNVLSALLYKNIAPPHACMYRTNVLRQIDGFDESLRAVEDWDILLRLALEQYLFAFSNKVTAIYRIHDTNMSSSKDLMLKSALQLVEKTFNNPLLPSRWLDLRSIILCIQYLETARRCWVNNYDDGAQHFITTMFEAMPETKMWLPDVYPEAAITLKHRLEDMVRIRTSYDK